MVSPPPPNSTTCGKYILSFVRFDFYFFPIRDKNCEKRVKIPKLPAFDARIRFTWNRWNIFLVQILTILRRDIVVSVKKKGRGIAKIAKAYRNEFLFFENCYDEIFVFVSTLVINAPPMKKYRAIFYYNNHFFLLQSTSIFTILFWNRRRLITKTR